MIRDIRDRIIGGIGAIPRFNNLRIPRTTPSFDLERLRALREAQSIDLGPGGFGGNQLIPGSGAPIRPDVGGPSKVPVDRFGMPIDQGPIRIQPQIGGPPSNRQNVVPLLPDFSQGKVSNDNDRFRRMDDMMLRRGELIRRAQPVKPPGGFPELKIGPDGRFLPPDDSGSIMRPFPIDMPENLDPRNMVLGPGGIGQEIIPTEIRGPDGRIVGAAGRAEDLAIPQGQFSNDGPGSLPVDEDALMSTMPVGDPVPFEPSVNLPPDVQVQETPPLPPSVPQGDAPFASSVRQVASGLDPLTEQLLFGIGGKGGFIPGAMRAAERTFFDEEGNPIVIDEKVAGFSPDQLAAMQLQRQAIGLQEPYLQQAAQAYGSGIQALASGLGESLGTQEQAVEDIARGVGEARGLRKTGLESLVGSLDEARAIGRGSVDRFGRRIEDVISGAEGAAGQFGQQLAGVAGRGIGDVERFERGLRDPESLLRGSVGGFDPGLTSSFYDPFEERVVQQTISDVMEQGAKGDIAARAGDIAKGGESAFGSRARLGAAERQEALGRGLGEALGSIRSGGFQRAQQAALGEFGRQREAERAAASGLAGLAGQRLGAGQNLSGLLRGLATDQLGSQQGLQNLLRGTASDRLAAQQQLGSTLAGYGGAQQAALSQAGREALAGQQALSGARSGLAGTQSAAGQALQAAQFGLGSSLQGLGAQAAGAAASDISSLYGMGSQQQAQAQQMLDAQRRNLQQRQMTPLMQYQALQPFVSMAPAGQFQTITDFTPKPSAMMTGIGTGLSAFGSLGNLYGGS